VYVFLQVGHEIWQLPGSLVFFNDLAILE
jgi:hypothetical protein